MPRSARLGSILAASLIVAIAVPAAAATSVVKRSSGPLTATLTPPSTHRPTINRNVPISVTATLGGKPAHATAVYQFLFLGAVVSTQYPFNNKRYSFTGHFKDNLVFPASSVGQPLTFRVVIKSGGRTVRLDWAISARK